MVLLRWIRIASIPFGIILFYFTKSWRILFRSGAVVLGVVFLIRVILYRWFSRVARRETRDPEVFEVLDASQTPEILEALEELEELKALSKPAEEDEEEIWKLLKEEQYDFTEYGLFRKKSTSSRRQRGWRY
ncbi:MAG: hypothetical protein LBQ90_00380 [Synergistaceae bacterium]|nr:hypothetical protein [Synergistaceae bacterium]